MKRSLVILSLLFLAACVDSTGISAESSRPPKGNPNAVVVVAEFADLECPACRAAHSTLNKAILDAYGNQIRFEFHHFPLRSIHRFTMELAEASECAADQGKFWDFVDIAFERQPDLKKGIVNDWATELLLDKDLFSRCTRSHIKNDVIMADYDEGVAAGVQGTPTYFVNGKKVESTLEAISGAIDEQLKGATMRL